MASFHKLATLWHLIRATRISVTSKPLIKLPSFLLLYLYGDFFIFLISLNVFWTLGMRNSRESSFQSMMLVILYFILHTTRYFSLEPEYFYVQVLLQACLIDKYV